MGVKSAVSLMKLLLILPCLLAGPSLVWSLCCPTKIVTGMVDDTLDGTYTFDGDRVVPPEDEDSCIDGCVYTKPGTPNDEYCFKTEQSEGIVQCRDSTGAVGTTESVTSLLSQKSLLEDEVANLETEVTDLEAEEIAAANLSSGLDEVDTKIEELTAEATTPVGRVQRQAATPCDDLAVIIEQLADATTTAKRLILVQQILSTEITRCKSKTKLSKTKVKIKVVMTETGARIKFILKEKTKIKGEIAVKKQSIIKITLQIEEIVGNTAKPPNPTVEITLKPTGEIEVSLKPTGEPGGEQAVSVEPTGEQAVSVEPTGEQAVSIILGGITNAPTGEVEVPMNSTGQQAVEIKPTGQQAVEIKPTGQQAVEITIGGSNSTGQQAVGITNGGSNGQNPVAMDGGATKQM